MHNNTKHTYPDFYNARVLVIGDLMLDSFYYGKVERISPEAPVPVVNVEHLEALPGGGANVAMNIALLGATSQLVGITGQDSAADTLTQKLSAAGVKCAFHRSKTISTIIKQRVISAHQQLLRLDFEKPLARDEWLHTQSLANSFIKQSSVVVLSDYGKGTLAYPQYWINLANQYQAKVLVDPKGQNFSKYRGAWLITPNMNEFESVAGKVTSETHLIEKAQRLLEELDINALLVTRSEHGMSLISNNQHNTFHLPAIARETIDVTGAGDTVIATLAATLAAGESLDQAVILANVAASIVVSKLGTATVSSPELQAEYNRHQGTHNTDHSIAGVVTAQQLKLAVKQAKERGEKIVFTNGCFDILHAGHVQYLQQARAQGDRLVVAINSDESVTRLKGQGRPVNSAKRRLAVLAGLESVDWVTCFTGDTPESLLQDIRPDILVKGGDYDEKGVVGWQIVKSYGGKIKVMDLVENCSTTAIVDKINSY